MKATLMRLVWIAEIVFTGLTSLSLLPVLVLVFADLILADLISGTSSTPNLRTDAALFFGLLVGLVGVWIALLMPDSQYQRNPKLRLVILAALAIAVVLLTWLAWGTLAILSVGVSLHHFVRLIMLSIRVAEPH